MELSKSYQKLSFCVRAGGGGGGWVAGGGGFVLRERATDMELEVIKLAAKGSCHGDKLWDCELLDAVADLGGQLVINGFEMTSESFALSLLGAENLLFGLLGSQESKPMDAGAGAVVPVIEGGNRDAKLLGDFLDGLALSPEFN